ncbi:MAG: 50S ribosomal protein L19e [Candidatus ainarchaeum sp.]|nr:50S ribosomal protein L19e [Candidatus ainarchaeum sp.]
MNMKSFRGQVSKLLNVGKSKVWISPDATTEVKKAITKDDIKEMVNNGTVKKVISGQSRGRARKLKAKKTAGRRRGPGTRKGVKTARTRPKEEWIKKVRAQRKYIREMKDKNEIDSTLYKDLYAKVRGGFFRSKGHIKLYVDKVKK